MTGTRAVAAVARFERGASAGSSTATADPLSRLTVVVEASTSPWLVQPRLRKPERTELHFDGLEIVFVNLEVQECMVC